MGQQENQDVVAGSAPCGEESHPQALQTEEERKAAAEKALIEEAERNARTYTDEKGRTFVDGVYTDENGKKTVDCSHLRLGFFKGMATAFRAGWSGNDIEYDREAYLERRNKEIAKLRRKREKESQVIPPDGITGDNLFEAFGIDRQTLSEARRKDFESIAADYANPAMRDKARALFVKMIHEYAKIDKMMGNVASARNLADKSVGKVEVDEQERGASLQTSKHTEAGECESNGNDATVNDADGNCADVEDGVEDEGFDLESWHEPDNVNLNCSVRAFWEKVKEASDMLDPLGGIRLELDEIIVSPFSIVLSIKCKCTEYAITGRPLLLSRLKNIVDDIVGSEYPHVLESLPGTSNIGIGLRRSFDDDAVPSLTEMVNSDAYKKLSGDPNAVPIVLGIDHMNRPLVVNLADSDNMVIVGSDTYDQSYTAEVVIKGLMFGRSPYDLQMTVLDGRDSCSIVRGYADMPYSKNSLSTPPTDKNLVSWCKRAISILDEAERDCAMRRKIIEGDDYEYSNIESYNRGTGRNLARRVVMMANFPHAAFNASDRAKEAVEHLRVRVRDFIELEKSDVGVHFVLWDFGNFWDSNDIDMGLVDSLLTVKGKTQFVTYTRFDELGSLLNFAGGREACGDNDLGPLVYRSPEGDIHYFQFAKVRDEERNLAVDKWGLTRTTVNDNIPDDETIGDSSGDEGTEDEVVAESAADDDEMPPHTGEDGGWNPTE